MTQNMATCRCCDVATRTRSIELGHHQNYTATSAILPGLLAILANLQFMTNGNPSWHTDVQTSVEEPCRIVFFVQTAEMEATCAGWRQLQEYLATEGHGRALNRRTPSLLRKAAWNM